MHYGLGMFDFEGLNLSNHLCTCKAPLMHRLTLLRPISYSIVSRCSYGFRSSALISLRLPNFGVCILVSPHVSYKSKTTRGLHLSSRDSRGKLPTSCILLKPPSRVASPAQIQHVREFSTGILSGIHPAILSPLVFAGLVVTLWTYKVSQFN